MGKREKRESSSKGGSFVQKNAKVKIQNQSRSEAYNN